MINSRARALALIAAGAVSMRARAVRAQSTTVRIGWTASDVGIPPYYGKALGIFARAGIDVELTAFNNSQAVSSAAAANAVDIGAADMIQVANGYLHGIPFAFFAGAALYSSAAPTPELLVMKDSPYRQASDLEGQTIAVIALNSISSISVQEWLRVNGVDASKVKIFEAPFPTMLPGLQRGTIAAALISEPFLSSASAETRVLAKTYDTVGAEFYITAWFASRDWIKASPDRARRFRAAVYELDAWINTHHAESAIILSDVTKLPLDSIRAMKRVTFATSLDTKMIQPVLDIATRYHAIEKRVAAADLIASIPG